MIWFTKTNSGADVSEVNFLRRVYPRNTVDVITFLQLMCFSSKYFLPMTHDQGIPEGNIGGDFLGAFLSSRILLVLMMERTLTGSPKSESVASAMETLLWNGKRLP